MADIINISIHQGDDWVAVLTVRNQDGTLANISGYTAKAEMRDDYAETGADLVAEIMAAVNSPIVNLSLGRTTTKAIPSGRYVWDCQLTAPGGNITTIAAGTADLVPEVTLA